MIERERERECVRERERERERERKRKREEGIDLICRDRLPLDGGASFCRPRRRHPHM